MLKIGHTIIRTGKRPGGPQVTIPVPEELETVPGIPMLNRDVDYYSKEAPLDTLNVEERASRDWANRIRDQHVEMQEIRKEHEALNRPLITAGRLTGDIEPTIQPEPEKDVTEEIRAKAKELGFLEVGFTIYDNRYTYARKRDYVKFEHAICLAYEQDFEPTQTIPSVDAEIVHSSTYRTEGAASLDLGKYINSLGYHAQVHSPNDNTGPYIPMFVAAGLGQLGACGYLLTPNEGSRCRLMLITTDAKVTYDQPVDYGIHAFCQVCQVCVNRCPGRALMREKVWWRGVEKNKLIYKRCRPVMSRYEGCAICMKVCPINKYGAKAVMEYYIETGQVLGKGTHDLEGFTLHDESTGKYGTGYFGPGELPTFDASFFMIPAGTRENAALEELIEHLDNNNDGLNREKDDEALFNFRDKLRVIRHGEVSDSTMF